MNEGQEQKQAITVEELIQALQDHDPKLRVYMFNSSAYSYRPDELMSVRVEDEKVMLYPS